MFDPLTHIHHFQHVLLFFQLQLQVGGNGVGQTADFINGRNGAGNFRRHFFGQFDVILELRLQRAGQCFLFALFRQPLFQLSHIGDATLVAELGLDHVGTLTTLNQHLDGAVRQFEQLKDC